MIRRLAPFAALLFLAGCNDGEAPKDDGVCFQAHPVKSGPPRYTALARGVGSLENCAVLLEAARLQGDPDTDGAYQGFFLSVDANQMTAGARREGFRYPVLQPPQRAEIDKDLRKLMAEHNGKIPADSDLSLVRQ